MVAGGTTAASAETAVMAAIIVPAAAHRPAVFRAPPTAGGATTVVLPAVPAERPATGETTGESGWMGLLRSAMPTTIIPAVGGAVARSRAGVGTGMGAGPGTGAERSTPASPHRRWSPALLAVAGVVAVLIVVMTTTLLLRDDDPDRVTIGVPTSDASAVAASTPEPSPVTSLSTGPTASPSPSRSRPSPSPSRSSSKPSPSPSRTSSPPASICKAGASIQGNWNNGGTVALSFTNTGTKAITGWTLTFTVAKDLRVGQGWNGTWSQSGSVVTVRSVAHNQQLAAGQTLSSVGANFTGPSQKPATVATGFALNGVACK